MSRRRGGALARGVAAGACLLLAAAGTAAAHFESNISGVRPAGMGGAFTALADDGNAFLFNPSGLAWIEEASITGMYASLYNNLNARIYTGENDQLGYQLVGLVYPWGQEWGSSGLGWTRFSSLLYQENTLYATYARSFFQDRRLAAGLSLKFLQWSVDVPVSAQSPEIEPYREQRQGFTADAGLIYRLTPAWSAGVSLANAVPVSMGEGETGEVGMQAKAGTAYTLTISEKDFFNLLTAAADAGYRDRLWTVAVGTELWCWQRQLGFRAGYNSNELTAGFSCRPSLPGSPLGLQLDYAYAYAQTLESTLGTHRLGLSLFWDPKIKSVPAAKKKVRRKVTRKPAPAPTPASASSGEQDFRPAELPGSLNSKPEAPKTAPRAEPLPRQSVPQSPEIENVEENMKQYLEKTSGQ